MFKALESDASRQGRVLETGDWNQKFSAQNSETSYSLYLDPPLKGSQIDSKGVPFSQESSPKLQGVGYCSRVTCS